MINSFRRCALYRHFDVDGVLLYVGISEQPGARSNGHASDSIWVQFAVREEAMWLDTREEALELERVAIQTEKPLFNRQHANYDKQPTIDYLARQLKCIQEHSVQFYAWSYLCFNRAGSLSVA